MYNIDVLNDELVIPIYPDRPANRLMKKVSSIRVRPKRGHALDLKSNEKVIHDIRPMVMDWTGPVVFGWLIAPLLYSLRRHYYTRYLITTDRIVIRRHRLSKESIELTYSGITAVQAKKRLIEKYTQSGTIELATTSEKQVALKAVPDHGAVAETIRDLISSSTHEIE